VTSGEAKKSTTLPGYHLPVPDEDRLTRERTFHDDVFATGARSSTAKYYATVRRSYAHYSETALAGAGGRAVLEYGCGTGSLAFTLAEIGDRVTGIDISPVAIEMAAAEAGRMQLPDIHFEVMDAERLEFPDSSVDLICGSAVLHHLDLDRAGHEIRRVLKPGGRLVLFEPLGHNPLINWYRRRTPHLRTVDEHPLCLEEVEHFASGFTSVDLRFFHITSLGAAVLVGRPGFRAVLNTADALDRLLLAIPPLKRLAWIVVLTLRI
jgi:SAM-dependent methyltransferase